MTVGIAISSVDAAREAIRWLAKRRRTTVSGLVVGAKLPSKTLVNFSSPNPNKAKIMQDVNVGQLLKLAVAADHIVVGRPIGGAHLVVKHEGCAPLEVRSPGGEMLEIPLTDIDDIRTLVLTTATINNASVSGLCHRANVSLSLTSWVNRTTHQKDLRLGPLVEALRAGGMELFLQPMFSNRREARLMEKIREEVASSLPS